MNKHGDWVWYELMTNDADAAARFYAPVVGWSISAQKDNYREVSGSAGHVGGIFHLTPDMTKSGARPVWAGYLQVDDVDASVRDIAAAGGTVLMPGKDMLNVGRIAMVTDPQGAMFYVIKPLGTETSGAFAAEKPQDGHCAWNELYTSDPAGALAFYGQQFGWKKDGDMDMGELGKYEFLRHGFQFGALMRKVPEMPVSNWVFYFRVPKLDAAIAAIRAGGGTVLNGPQDVPGGDRIIQALDPQGAFFALVSNG